MSRQPILFFRDPADGHVVSFMKLSETNLNALRRLASDGHVFNISRFDYMLVLEQGDAWDRVPRRLVKHGFKRIVRATAAGGDGDVRSVCIGCKRFKDKSCAGWSNGLPLLELGRQRHPWQKNDIDNIEAMRHAVVEDNQRFCLLYPRDDRDGLPDKGTLTHAVMRAAGFEPMKSPSIFADLGDVGEYEIEAVQDLVAKEVDLSDTNAVSEVVGASTVREWMKTGWGKRGAYGKRESVNVTDLCFDEALVETQRVIARVRAGPAKSARKAYKAYRSENCSRCLYPCDLPPWDTEKPRPLTHERVVSEFVPNDEALAWMAAHTLCGQTGQFENPDTGRYRAGIGSRPTPDGKSIVIKSLVPPYEKFATLSVGEYWAQAVGNEKYMEQAPVLATDDETRLAYTHWALRALEYLTSWDEGRFVVNDRTMRNDVLSTRLWDDCSTIAIGSDTRASSTGGMREKGFPIYSSDRPRFTTHYEYPFAESIWGWFENCPDACTGRRRRR